MSRSQRQPSGGKTAKGQRLCWWFLLVTGSWTLADVCGLLGPLQTYTFVVLASATCFATAVGVRRYRPAARWPWAAIGVALVLFLIGGFARQSFQTLGNLTASRSLIPDSITLPGYVLWGVGLTGLARARRSGHKLDLDVLLDGLVAALAALALAWVYTIDPVLFHQHSPLPVKVVLACYPTMSLFLVTITARFAFTGTARRRLASYSLLTALAFMLAGDVLYMFLELGLVVPPAALVDLPYALAYICFGVTVLHPSMIELSTPSPSRRDGSQRGRLLSVAIALAVPALVVLVRWRSGASDRLVLSGVIVALTVTATIRVFRALHAYARSEVHLAHQATHDSLTGLPNRVLIQEHLSRLLDDHGPATTVGLLFIDLDRFKLVNDTFGHAAGDELLVAVSGRLGAIVSDIGVLARLGGDEFVIALDNLSERTDLEAVAERVRTCFRASFKWRDTEIFTSASIGAAWARSGVGTTQDDLIRDADTAMYEAKDLGGDVVAIFDTPMRERISERVMLERHLRYALDAGELHVEYQPILTTPGGGIEGMEALMRWSHPELGRVPPDKFIPIAEETELIIDFGQFVLREALRSVAYWRSVIPGAEDLYVSVNVSIRQMRDDQLLDIVRQELFAHGLDGSALKLELTESLLMDNPDTAINMLRGFQELNVGVWIDDFGTGYSSLAYLKQFPVERVKIDRSFVMDLDEEDTSEETLIAAIVGMARALGITTVAEGVETTAQAARLLDLGCDAQQGYLYARPTDPRHVPGLWDRPQMAQAAQLASIL